MKKGGDFSARFAGIEIVHHNLPGLEKTVQLREHLLFVPLQGEMEVKVAGATFKLGSGRMLYLPPKIKHSFGSSRHQGERVIALVDAKIWERTVRRTFAPSVSPLNQLSKELLFYLLLNPRSRHATSLVGVFVETLAESLDLVAPADRIVSMDHVEARAGDARVQAALAYMKEHLGEAISMERVAKKSGLSLRSLNRLVLGATGLSPRHVLIRYRIERAAEALLTGKQSVTEVALDVGYGSLSQFIASFRNVTGYLPSEYGKVASYRNS